VESGGQPGNQNAAKAREFRQALKRVMARRFGTASEGLEKVAEVLLDAVASSEQWAVREVIDRIDGKPAQTIGGDPENPIEVKGLAVMWGNGADSQTSGET
jgi:uncharacterized Rossmann fold enzyme